MAEVAAPPVLCAHCGGEVDAGGVSPVGLARCRGCQRFLDLDPLLPARPAAPPHEDVTVPAAQGRPAPAPLHLRRDAPFPMPDGATVVEAPGQLTVFLPDPVGRWIVAPVAAGLGGLAALQLLWAPALSAPLALAAGAAVAACGLVAVLAAASRRYLRVDDGGLRVGTTPIPFLRGAPRQAERPAELWVERNWVHVAKQQYRFIWELYGSTASGARVALLEGGRDPIEAHWLGERLAARLGARFQAASDPGREGRSP